MTLLRSRTARSKPQMRQFDQGKSISLPAPTGGLNLRDDIGDLKPNEARVLDNWSASGVIGIRKGKAVHVSGMGLASEVKTLAAYVGYSANAMLAGANGKIFDVTNLTYSAAAGAPAANDTYTKILLKMDGADASTTFTDSNAGGSAHTWTAAGNAQIDTAASKFGGAAGLFDGTGDYITTPDHADFTLGSGDWTVDFWFYCTATGGTLERIAGQCDSGAANTSTSIRISRSTGNTISAVACVGSTSYAVTGTSQFTDVINAGWVHCAFVRYGNILRLFINGSQEGGDGAISGTVNDSSSAFAVGRIGELTADPWTGWIDEFRLSVGVARWTDAFTPPTAAYSPKELAIGFTQDRWQTALYGDRLFFVNGTDNPQVYNGSTVAGIVWTDGVSLVDNSLINIALVRNRLWFCEVNQAWAWYGAVGQITAASNLTKFQLEQIASGGYLMAVGSWSRDGGDGADDLTVFIMSTGEIIIYQGDPATSFVLIGKFYGAPPIGRQCLFQVGGELVVITTQGLLPISTAIGGSVTAQDIAAIDPWGKVAPGITSDASMDKDNPGWHGVFDRGIVYLNVPQETGALSRQWVLNTRTGAWTTHSSINGSAWCVHAGVLYLGTMTGGVMSLTGDSDDGTSITARANGAFVYPDRRQNTNLFTAARPKLKANGTVSGTIGVDVDFNLGLVTGATSDFGGTGSSSAWNSSPWDSTPWVQDAEVVSRWYSVNGLGKAVSVRFTLTALTSDVEWYSTDLLFKSGGIR